MEENAANWVKMQALEIRRARVELGLLLCEFEQIIERFQIWSFSVKLT